MRINDILTETNSNEGIVSDIGTGVGKAAGATARGIGAVAGGVRGVWDAAKQGFQAGRNLVGGGGSSDPKIEKARELRMQADQLDGGNSAEQTYAPQPTSRANSGAGGQSRPYTSGGQTAPAANAPATPTAPAADAGLQKLQQALQHIKGPDIERIRGMLKKRAGIAEGIMSNIAGGLGKMNRGYVDAKSAYQQARGGDMTPQEMDLVIASMPKDQAADLLNFFDTLYPVAAGSPADSGAPTPPATPTAPAASTTPTPPGGAAGAAGAGAAAVGSNQGAGFQAAGRQTPPAPKYNINLPKPATAPAAKLKTPPPQVRQTVPKPPAAKSINGLKMRTPTTEGLVRSSFLGIDL